MENPIANREVASLSILYLEKPEFLGMSNDLLFEGEKRERKLPRLAETFLEYKNVFWKGKKIMRKKTLCAFLSIIILMLQLCSCAVSVPEGSSAVKKDESAVTEKEKTPLDVLEDIPVVLVGTSNFKNSKILQYAQYLYEDYNVKLKFLSETANEREAELSSLRVEIMAGGGPDAFILPTNEPGVSLNDGSPRELPFMNIERQMRSGIFLPMDRLISESDHINIEDHYDVILDAGKTEEGQMVLPLLFSYNVFLLNKAQLRNPNMQMNTWDEVINCGDEKVISFLRGRMIRWFGAQYKDFVDYDTETLLVTPNAIANDMLVFSNTTTLSHDELATFDVSQQKLLNEFALTEWSECPDSAYLLPLPNTEGGLTAYVTAYAAINRNTEHAEEVFQLIELFFNNEIQSNEGVRIETSESVAYYGSNSRPNTLLLGSISGVATGRNAYSEKENEFLASLVNRTNSVRFYTDVECVLIDAARESRYNSDPNVIAEDICDEINMILAE